MVRAKQGDTVQVHYTGRLEDGTVFDTSTEANPLEFTIGDEQVIPGFEQAIIGMQPGESKTVTVPMSQAFGPYNEELVFEADRERAFPSHFQPEVGQHLQMRTRNGEKVSVVVLALTDTTVTLDTNPPLAGKDLTFDIELVGIA